MQITIWHQPGHVYHMVDSSLPKRENSSGDKHARATGSDSNLRVCIDICKAEGTGIDTQLVQQAHVFGFWLRPASANSFMTQNGMRCCKADGLSSPAIAKAVRRLHSVAVISTLRGVDALPIRSRPASLEVMVEVCRFLRCLRCCYEACHQATFLLFRMELAKASKT